MPLWSQGNFKEEGFKYFKNEKYSMALNSFKRVKNSNKNAEILFKKAICNFHLNNLSIALSQFKRATKNGYDKPDYEFYLAKIYHAQEDYKKAVRFYKSFLNKIRKEESLRLSVIHSIKQCGFAINNRHNKELAFVENIGETVNTVYDDFNPIQSKTNSDKYYFSAKRPGSTGGLRNKEGLPDEYYGSYFYDIFSTEIINGSWQFPKTVDEILNTPKHEFVLDVSENGSDLYFLRSRDLKAGGIYKEQFENDVNTQAISQKVQSPVVGERGDIYLRVFNDSTYVFASNRIEGYGGYDIYMTIRRDGIWSEPINLGPKVNSSYNEVAPFISKDGKSVYYSSDRTETFGGFDIFESSFMVEGGYWSAATNLGLPINSAGNDMYFTLSSDGTTATLSSDRKTGYGGYDIYIAYLKNRNKSQLINSSSIAYINHLEYEARLAEEARKRANDPNSDPSLIDISDELLAEYNERPQTVINISPLYYGDNDNIFLSKNNIVIDDIIDLMHIYPEVSVLFTCHSTPENLKEYDLYFSIKRAEKLEEYLINKGIDSRRIMLRGVGANYPMVKQSSAGQTTNMADKINRRLDIQLMGIENLPITVLRDDPVVVDYLQDRKFQIFETLMDGVSFRVKIASVKQLYKNDVLAEYEDVIIDKQGDEYVYSVGLYSDFFSALKVKNQLANKNFRARIRPYYNGVWMTERQIQALAPEDIELRRYIDNRN